MLEGRSMALSERVDKQTRINEVEAAYSGKAVREKIRAGDEAGLYHISVLVLGARTVQTQK